MHSRPALLLTKRFFTAILQLVKERGERMAEKTITIRVDEELHKDVKMLIAKRGIKLKEYLLELIKDDLAKEAAKEKGV